MANSSFKITRALPDNVVHGALGVAAILGTMVSIKDNTLAQSTTDGTTSVAQNQLFELSSGKKPFILNRDVIAGPRPLTDIIFQDANLLSPALIGQQVSAREVQEAEFEGADFLTLTGQGAIASNVPINTPLTTISGKLALISAITLAAYGHAGAGAVALANAAVGAGVRSVVQISDLMVPVAAGHNGAGSVTVAGSIVGDVVSRVVKGDGTDVTNQFEATVSVAGQVQQTGGTDLSATKLEFFLNPAASAASLFESTISVAGQIQQTSAADLSGREFQFVVEPLNQRVNARVVSILAPEDAVNNTFRLAVSFEA